jgi:mannitol-1-/sugar-/sorbitol-6-/2-deoxyglucose-6-phosphatase
LIKAVIFDMDGLLINSEPFWVESEKKVFETVGVHLTDDLCYQTFGMRIQEVVPYWHRQFPWDETKRPFEQISGEIVENVCGLINKYGTAFDDVEYILNFFRSKNIPMALASSSPMQIINAVMNKLGIAGEFKIIYSAENEEYGKPHPAVYITTAEKMGVKAIDCAAFEDSFNGIISAKAAMMKTVAVPELYNFYNPRFDIADVKLRRLKEFNEEEFKKINLL